MSIIKALLIGLYRISTMIFVLPTFLIISMGDENAAERFMVAVWGRP